MNKLLSGKAVVLSVLALVASESLCMQQEPIQQNWVWQNRQVACNVLLSAKNQILAKCSPKERIILFYLKDIAIHRLVYQWYLSEKGERLTGEIGSKNIWEFILNHHSKDISSIIKYMCQNIDKVFNRVSKLKKENEDMESVNFSNAIQDSYAFNIDRSELRQGWSMNESAPWKWLTSKGMESYTFNQLCLFVEVAIARGGNKIYIGRNQKRNKEVFVKFLDERWEALEPLMELAFQQLPYLNQQASSARALRPFPSVKIPQSQQSIQHTTCPLLPIPQILNQLHSQVAQNEEEDFKKFINDNIDACCSLPTDVYIESNERQGNPIDEPVPFEDLMQFIQNNTDLCMSAIRIAYLDLKENQE